MERRFHVSLQRLAGRQTSVSTVVDGIELQRLAIDPASLTAPLTVTFDDAYERLSRLPRMFIEPDGSFVWTSEERDWQVDGQLHDGGAFLQSVELRGCFPAAIFERLMPIFASSADELAVQLIREGVFVKAGEFAGLLREVWARRASP